MAKHKSPSVLNSRVIRVNIGDYLLLTELSRKLDITVAKALHLAITQQAKQEQIVTPRTQIPMPIRTAIRAIPTTAVRAIPTTAVRAIPITAIATNGNKAIAFRIKTKGVKYD
ncbi:hypothetical protein ES708_27423 [subsurface metagenome]